MNTMRSWRCRWAPLLAGLVVACGPEPANPGGPADGPDHAALVAAPATIPVAGSAVHYFSTAIIHSQTPGDNGMVQRSTDIVRLTGDLDGYLLYHATSKFDFQSETLVNVGTQMFSGSVAGSEPVLLHDDRFRFDVDLASGAVTGRVYLGRSADGPDRGSWYECELAVVGTGMTPDGDGLADYTGECVRRGRPG
jgi:hypothetical protein